MMSSKNFAIQCKGLSAGYDFKVLDEVNFSVAEGSLTAIVGPNGAGKSTLLKVLCGLLLPLAGELFVLGQPIKTNRDRLWVKREIAYLAQVQAPGKLPITVFDSVLLGRWGRYFSGIKMPSKTDRERVEEVLRLVGMEHLKDRDLRTLSGGQRQRAALARALVRDPQIMLMDEPTTYLDARAQAELINLIQILHQRLGITTIVVTHQLEKNWDFTSRWVIEEGKLNLC